MIFLLTPRACLAADLSVADQKAASGRHYLIIRPTDCKIDFVVVRPSKRDDNVLLCFPAAFTSRKGGICGLYACRGEVGKDSTVDHQFGGGIKFEDGKCKISDTKGGALIDQSFLDSLRITKSSFFQQFQIVKDGRAEGFKDQSQVQRRCIVTFADGQAAMVESKGDVSFRELGEDLLGLGVRNAIYTDMGPYGGGWYRDLKNNGTVSIGKDHSLTKRQTNWVIFEKALPR